LNCIVSFADKICTQQNARAAVLLGNEMIVYATQPTKLEVYDASLFAPRGTIPISIRGFCLHGRVRL